MALNARRRIASIVVVLVWTAGCLGTGVPRETQSTGTPSAPGVTSNGTPGERFLQEWTLNDFGPGQTGKAVQITATRNTNFSLSVESSYDAGASLPYCMLYGWQSYSIALIGRPPSNGGYVSGGPVNQSVSQPSPFPFSYNMSHDFTVPANGTFVVFMTHSDPEAWQRFSGTLAVRIQGDHAVQAQQTNVTQAACLDSPDQMNHGVRAGVVGSGAVQASHVQFNVKGNGSGWAFVNSDVLHSAALHGPNGTVWETGTVTMSGSSTQLGNLTAGPYNLTVEQAVGTSLKVGLVVADFDQ